MPTAGCEPSRRDLLPTGGRERIPVMTLALMRPYRRVVPAVSVLRQPSDGAPRWRARGCKVGRHRVRRLMRLLGLEAIYRKPRTSVSNPEHRVYPYLLRGLTIERPNQVWCADMTYIPVQGGFLYLVAIMDWASSARAGVAVVQHDGHRVLPGGAWLLEAWKATGADSRDLQHRSGQPVHQYRVHGIVGDRTAGYAARWTVAVGVWTTCSSSGCGAP